MGQREASESRVSDKEEENPGPGRQRANGQCRLGVGLGSWLKSVGWEWIVSMVSLSFRLLSRSRGDGSGY